MKIKNSTSVEIDYSMLWDIVWEAKFSLNRDVKNGVANNSDLKRLEVCAQLLDWLTEVNGMNFEIREK